MSFLKKFAENMGGGASDDIDVDEYLDTLGLENEEVFEEEADVWVKSFVLESTEELSKIKNEIGEGNVVILNIEPMYKRNAIKMKQVISDVKSYEKELDGDVVRISDYKLLLTPRGMKVYRIKKK